MTLLRCPYQTWADEGQRGTLTHRPSLSTTLHLTIPASVPLFFARHDLAVAGARRVRRGTIFGFSGNLTSPTFDQVAALRLGDYYPCSTLHHLLRWTKQPSCSPSNDIASFAPENGWRSLDHGTWTASFGLGVVTFNGVTWDSGSVPRPAHLCLSTFQPGHFTAKDFFSFFHTFTIYSENQLHNASLMTARLSGRKRVSA